MSRPEDISRAPGFTIEVHTDFDRLKTLWPHSAASETAGYGAPAAVCHVFQTAEFIVSWLDTYGRAVKAQPLFVVVREPDGSPLLLLPLAIVRKGRARVLGFLDATACDYNAPVLFPTTRIWTAEAAVALWTSVKAALPRFDLVVLDKMPAEVRGLANPLYLVGDSDNPESCHVNDLDRPWADVERGIHGLRTLRKSARALERLAPTRLEVAETPEARAAILDVLLAQKQRRFEETQVPGFDVHPEKRKFFVEAATAFADVGSLHLSALRVGDETVATLWGVLHRGHYYALMIGFETGSWASYSPGRVLYFMLMRVLHEQGCTLFDLGIGDEPWKLAQSDRTIPLRMHTEAVSLRGRAYLVRVDALAGLRRSARGRRLRPYKWVVLRGLRRCRPTPATRTDLSGRTEP